MTRELLSARIKELRESVPTPSGRKLTQRQLGAQLGASQQTVSSWENGTALPEPKYLPKLAEVLGWEIHELYSLHAVAQGEVLEEAQEEAQEGRDAVHAMERFTDTYSQFHAAYEEIGETVRYLKAMADQMAQRFDEFERRVRAIESSITDLTPKKPRAKA